MPTSGKFPNGRTVRVLMKPLASRKDLKSTVWKRFCSEWITIILVIVSWFGGPSASAATRIHNDGFTTTNQALPDHPHYGSAVTADGPNWSTIIGLQGIRGTPDIQLHWNGEGGGDVGYGVETYKNFDGRGAVIQLDGGKTGGTRRTFLTFTPAATAGVRIDSFDLDIANDQAHEVQWFIRDAGNVVLSQGTWTRSNRGRDTITPAFQGNLGQTLVLELNHTIGGVTYLGLDNLAFDQTRQANGPGLVALQAHHAPGESVGVQFWSAPGHAQDRIVLCAEGAAPGTTLDWLYVGGTKTATQGLSNGTVTFPTPTLSPGRYAAWLLAAGTGAPLAGPAGFEVDAPAIQASKVEYDYGENLVATFQGGPGRLNDMIALYPVGVTPSSNTWYLDYLYTSGTRTAEEGIRRGTVTFDRHFAPPGEYYLWFLGPSYQAIAEPVFIRVRPVGTAALPRWLCSSVRVRHAVAGISYETRISAQASDPGDALTFTKVAGPAWLTVAADGKISGTPAAADAGANRFTLRATDSLGHAADTEMVVNVFRAGSEHVGQLKILSHNMLLRWEKIDDGVRKGVEAIVLSDADVVGFQESGPDVAMRAAAMLGWYYVPPGNGWGRMISRYPVAQSLPSGGGAHGARLRLCSNPLREVIVYNCYHSANHSALSAAGLNGATAESVLSEEMLSSRPQDTQTMLNTMAPYLANADTVPIFLTGDFNTSSHLDWTPATAARHNGVGAIAWPGSTAIANAGMKDSFRTVHPDPVMTPGITWTPLFRDYKVKDRIDFIYYKGRNAEAIDSEVFHTAIETTLGNGEDLPLAHANTWPTDHASVLSTFRLDPVDADGDGLSDAWENRWFDGLEEMPGALPLERVREMRWHMLLGSDPRNGASPGLQVGAGELYFPLAEIARGTGLRLECSDTMETGSWVTLWSFDADPRIDTALFEVAVPTAGGWQVHMPLDTGAKVRSFYRLRCDEPE